MIYFDSSFLVSLLKSIERGRDMCHVLTVRVALIIVLFSIAAPLAEAMILYDGNSNANNYNISVPVSPTINDPTEVLWNHVVQICKASGAADASGIYLGEGYILTANHVTGSRYYIQGVEYLVDISFNGTGYRTVTNSSDQAIDLKVVKILSPPPSLGSIQMMSSSQSATSSYSLYIGWGVGKGTPQTTDPSTQGWTWGSEADTAAQRWGRNATFSSSITFPDTVGTYLGTAFDRSLFSGPYSSYNNDVYNITLGDSGGGLFQYVDGEWMLAGVGTNVSVNWSAYYDRNSATGGDQPDDSYYMSMPAHSADVLRAIPEPSVRWLLLLAFSGYFVLHTCRRRVG